MSISTLTRIDEICSTISETYRGKDKKVILINTSDVLAILALKIKKL